MSKVAELWANKVIAGDRDYTEVPAKLKEEVDTLLTEAGYKVTPKKKATLKKA